ncbi:hypothetical protein SEA_WOFFORD_222 [Streptomyces phage Wofford]|uniref:Uncharacterized protein n=1 Tax=Streptomyces phage Wofford TaxID=2283267 RepID=A0A345MA39_9CAUD|nr:hypothetical protein HWB78_gp095 [Streptomyces phage Wollford]AXH67360.1 hypothetical protein SEA_WOFFORD_222 [Streptomyces phage Wollford]
MLPELSTPPNGYTWELKESNGDPLFGDMKGMTYEIYLRKDNKIVERRGVFVPENRMDELPQFIKGMEESLRLTLK